MKVVNSGRRMKKQLLAKEKHNRYIYPDRLGYPFSVLSFLHPMISFSELSPAIWCLARDLTQGQL